MNEGGLQLTRLGTESNPVIGDLVRESEREGFGMLRRLVKEWTCGANRFAQPGEALFAVRIDSRIVGICGLNLDPFAENERVGRVRRLYVAPGLRRRGIGSALVRAVIDAARGRFDQLRLLTREPTAAAFYESLGFQPVAGDPRCSHAMDLT